MANTLPTEIAHQLIDDTAATLQCSPEDVQSTLDQLDAHDITEVLEAMQSLGTTDASVLTAYLSSEAVLDDNLDYWLDEVG